MKRWDVRRLGVIVALGLGAAVLYACGVLGGDGGTMMPAEAAAAQPLSGAKAEIRDAFVSYAEAISRKDIEGCVDAFAPGPDTVMLGTGPGERWVGPDEIRDAHEHFLGSFDTETTQRTWSQGQVQGNVAWIAAMFEVSQYSKNVKNEFFLNMSAVLVKQKGKWQIAQIHFSNLTGPDLPPEL